MSFEGVSLEAAHCYLTLGIRRKLMLMPRLLTNEEAATFDDAPSVEVPNQYKK